jgi:hypothetical protein
MNTGVETETGTWYTSKSLTRALPPFYYFDSASESALSVMLLTCVWECPLASSAGTVDFSAVASGASSRI